MFKVLDCTLRDGGHENNWDFTPDFVTRTINGALKSGAEFFEIGYRNRLDSSNKGKFYYCTPNLLKPYHKIKGALKIGIMTDISRFCAEDFEGASKDFVDFVRIASHPDTIKDTLNAAVLLHSRGYDVFIQLMEIPNVKSEHYEILKNFTHKNILKSIYIADSYGTVKPQDLDIYFEKLRHSGYEKISFHAHNNSGLALENTLHAIKSGAYSIDVSQNGLGGNLDSALLLK